MSLYKTKHLTHKSNLRKKSFKIEVLNFSNSGVQIGYSKVWLMCPYNTPYWQRCTQRNHPYELTGYMRICLKSKGRGRPHMFQKYITPHTERWKLCL